MRRLRLVWLDPCGRSEVVVVTPKRSRSIAIDYPQGTLVVTPVGSWLSDDEPDAQAGDIPVSLTSIIHRQGSERVEDSDCA